MRYDTVATQRGLQVKLPTVGVGGGCVRVEAGGVMVVGFTGQLLAVGWIVY